MIGCPTEQSGGGAGFTLDPSTTTMSSEFGYTLTGSGTCQIRFGSPAIGSADLISVMPKPRPWIWLGDGDVPISRPRCSRPDKTKGADDNRSTLAVQNPPECRDPLRQVDTPSSRTNQVLMFNSTQSARVYVAPQEASWRRMLQYSARPFLGLEAGPQGDDPRLATLKWLGKRHDILPNEQCVQGGTDVHLEGTRYRDRVPDRFEVFKAHMAIVRTWRTAVRHLPELTAFDHVDADPAGPGTARSRAWQTPRKRRLAPRIRLVFQDDANNGSTELRVTNRVEVESVELLRLTPDPTGWQLSGPVFHLRTPVDDPGVFVSLLTPWTAQPDPYGLTFGEYLHVIAEEEASGADSHDVEGSLVNYLADYLPNAEPSAWGLRIEPKELTLQPGDRADIRVVLHADTRARTLFAVAVTPDGNREETSVSDLLVLEVTAPGTAEVRDSLQR